jgi:hypothetical protein
MCPERIKMVVDSSAIMKSLLGINWRTTASAILPMLTSITMAVGAISRGEWPTSNDLAVIASLFSIGYGLIVAKDRNVTGGTVSNVDGTVARPVSLIEGGHVV